MKMSKEGTRPKYYLMSKERIALEIPGNECFPGQVMLKLYHTNGHEIGKQSIDKEELKKYPEPTRYRVWRFERNKDGN